MDWEKIVEDYKTVQEKISRILINRKPNCFVEGADYLKPTLITPPILGFEHPLGELQHYFKIRTALEFALTMKKIPERLMPPRAPKYLTELLEESPTGKP